MIEKLSVNLDLLKVTRRLGFFTTLWVTVYATKWSLAFPAEAIVLGYSASEVAMIRCCNGPYYNVTRVCY